MDSYKITQMLKNIKIVKFYYYIWNHHKKCIQISTNMTAIREIAFQISDM